MAIVEMQRLTLLALKSDRRKLLSALQAMGCVEVTEAPDEVQEYAAQAAPAHHAQHLTDIRWALQKLAKYDTDPKPIFGTFPEIDHERAHDVLARSQDVLGLIRRLEAIERRRGERLADEVRVRAAKDALEPWRGLEVSMRDLTSLKTTDQFLGALPARNLPSVLDALHGQPVTITQVGQDRDRALVHVAAHKSDVEAVRQALSAHDFTREMPADIEDRTPAQAIAAHEARLAQVEAERGALDEETATLAQAIRDMKVLHDLFELEQKQAVAMQRSAETDQAFLLRGWVPKRAGAAVRQQLLNLSPSAMVALQEPQEDENPSVQLQNGPFVGSFEPVVEGFSLPDYRSVDPTALMAPFYATLFGMMLSDAGYGLLMAIAIPIYIKVKKIKMDYSRMLRLLMYGGLATIIWGIAFNTVFGFNPVPQITSWFPFDPVNRPLEVMVLCMGVGVLHLFAGLGMAAYMNIKRGDPLAVLGDQVGWALLLVGLGLMLLPDTQRIGQILALVGAGLILLLTKRGERNPIKRIFGGLGALYGVSSWVSDILSYMRLFGMGLATGVIGMVFNQLIGMVWAGGIFAKAVAVVLFVFSHLFNLGINALGAYVHASRLQYIEFFGKFFEDGGKPFRPLDMKTRYVSIQSAKAQ